MSTTPEKDLVPRFSLVRKHGAVFATRSELTPAFVFVKSKGVNGSGSDSIKFADITKLPHFAGIGNQPSQRELHPVAFANQNSAAALL